MRRRAALYVFLLLLHSAAARAENAAPYREMRHVMGTVLEIIIYHDDAKEARRLLDRGFALAQNLDDLLSNYKPESEISRLNQRAGHGRIKVTPELYHFIAVTKQLWQKTDGAFDITIGPIMDLWKKAEKTGVPPSLRALEESLRLVGMRHIILHESFEIELCHKGMILDTGGIGKGYAVDEIASYLKRAGVKNALINFGHSSIYALGSPPELHAWRLLLKFPDQEPLGILELKDQAFSASDTFGRPFEIAGKKYAHLVDPKNGTPLTHRVQAVVLGPSSTEAEALSKYVILRGWKRNSMLWDQTEVLRVTDNGEMERSESFPLQTR
ncbi:MAG: FAD:protein FMN transferase [Candidatus Binatia bacterium]